MSNLLQVGTGALNSIGMLGAGQTPNAEDGALMLRYANLLLDQWGTKRLYLYYVSARPYSLTAGLSPHTIGPSGATFTAVRPTFVESAQANVPGSNIWLPMSIVDKAKWDAIRDKGSEGDIPDIIWPQYTFPNLTINTNPLTRAAVSILLGCWEPFTAFSDLFTAVAFPPAYEEFLEASLAVALAPHYDQPLTQTIMLRQQKAEAAVMSINAQGMVGAMDEGQLLKSPNLGAPIPTGPAGAA